MWGLACLPASALGAFPLCHWRGITKRVRKSLAPGRLCAPPCGQFKKSWSARLRQ
jgi:hypothetical protein